MEFKAWDDYTRQEQLEQTYSDMYKDVYGIRPRGHQMSEQELEADLDFLQSQIQVQIEENTRRQQKAVFDIENTITTIQENCSCDRNDALRYLKDGEGDDFYNWEDYCFSNHLPSNYFKEVA